MSGCCRAARHAREIAIPDLTLQIGARVPFAPYHQIPTRMTIGDAREGIEQEVEAFCQVSRPVAASVR